MKRKKVESKFVVCINNEDYEVSLELRKIYRILPDPKAAEHHYLRIIDKSGEDHLYPESYFMPIELPEAIETALSLAS